MVELFKLFAWIYMKNFNRDNLVGREKSACSGSINGLHIKEQKSEIK